MFLVVSTEDGKMDYEKQLTAMKTVMEVLAPLEDADKKAVWNWVSAQLGLSQHHLTSQAVNAAGGAAGATQGAALRQGTVSVVSQKLGVKSARDLLVAAAAHLTLYQGKENFTKEELVACAKEARSWKAAYTNQMALNIKRMCDSGVLFEKSRDIFSLSDASLADVEERIR